MNNINYWFVCLCLTSHQQLRSYGEGHGLNFEVLSDRLEKPGIESVTPVFKVNDLSTTPQQFLNNYQISIHLRNEFDFWKVHGIMYTSGLLQS